MPFIPNDEPFPYIVVKYHIPDDRYRMYHVMFEYEKQRSEYIELVNLIRDITYYLSYYCQKREIQLMDLHWRDLNNRTPNSLVCWDHPFISDKQFDHEDVLEFLRKQKIQLQREFDEYNECSSKERTRITNKNTLKNIWILPQVRGVATYKKEEIK